MIVTSLSALADSVRSTLARDPSSPARHARVEHRDHRQTNRIEDVFAPVDRNHDGAIQPNELTSALPRPAPQTEQRQSIAIRRYTA